ncbi:MAG: MBOAT family protein [Lachnospiraceae bacterium]|nr:MBOAT family protein [Lachnospiraceae bacterium]
MLFSSITFLYVFLPIIVALYFIVPYKVKNYVLLLASLIFYAWGEPKYIIIMIVQIILGYIFAIIIDKYRDKSSVKYMLAMIVIVNLGFLVYFKYANFFIRTFGQVTGVSVNLLKIALPIGISFYTFQIVSYVIDVYRGTVALQKNPFYLATYISFFPQLIAGPIVRYVDVEKQLVERKSDFDKIAHGIRRFVLGLGKKVLIANTLGELCDIFRGSSDLSVAYYWLYAISFTLHIYYDFSGYSDMAIGLGKIFGFDFIENFNYPYISKSITEFWRRWHMSLGTWFRDYVYIPLGGNRVSKAKFIRNIIIVWFLTGFWHGADWNFIIWGCYFAIFLLIEKFFLIKKLENMKVFNHIYVMFVVIIGFVIFNATSMNQVISDIGGLIGIGELPFVSSEFLYYIRSYGLVLIIAIIGATPLPKKVVHIINSKANGNKLLNLLEPLVMLIIMILITAYLVDGSFNPFLYFRF